MTALVADIGGTRIKLAVVRNRRVLAQDCIDARSYEGLAPQLPRIAQSLKSLCAKLDLHYRDCRALSIAFPSLVETSPHPRVLTAYGKYEDAPKLDLAAWARSEFNLSLFLENDARMALLGEWKSGAGEGSDELVMVTLGTGIGTAVVMHGHMLRGRHGQAGVLGGHLTVRVDGRHCTCGNRGCGEAEASTFALHRAALGHEKFHGSGLDGFATIDYATVFRLAKKNDDCAVALREECIRIWSAVIVNLIHAYDPERVIVGGGIMAGQANFLPDLERTVRAHAHTPWGEVGIVPAKLGDAAALIGGEVLVRDGH